MFHRGNKRELSSDEIQIFRERWEWGGNYAVLWIIVTIVIFGGAHAMFDYVDADDRIRVPAFVLLSTLIIVNAIWRAVGALAARLALKQRPEK